MVKRIAGSLVVALVCATGCPSEHEQAAGGRWSKRAEGPVVATVNGVEIGLSDVRELVDATGLSPREALRRLEDDVLLSQHAQTAGFGRSSLQGREAKRALVRALLASAVERDVRLDTITPQQVQARFDAVRESNHLPPEALARYDAQIREQLVLEQRQAVLEKLLAQLRGRFGVVLDSAQVDSLLADSALWPGSS